VGSIPTRLRQQSCQLSALSVLIPISLPLRKSFASKMRGRLMLPKITSLETYTIREAISLTYLASASLPALAHTPLDYSYIEAYSDRRRCVL
jgi:hypothetical protein